MQYYKGNTHCHTTNSDGELTPAEVGEYYKSIGYDFISATDHHTLTTPDEYESSGITGIQGAEFGGVKLADTVGLWITKAKEMLTDKDFPAEYPVGDAYQKNIENIRAVGGVPILCHPLWHWTFDYDKIKDVTNWSHFELCNASPDCNAIPIPGYAPAEEMWDKLLSNGRRVFGVASDDAHQYNMPYTPNKPLGGRGFIMLKSNSLEQDELRTAFEAGQFYASTGITLEQYALTPDKLIIEPIVECKAIYSFEFFGENGKLLQHTTGRTAEYKIKGDELYIRVRIASTTGQWLWTQPIFLDDLDTQSKWINS